MSRDPILDSYVLRHCPDSIKLALDPQGWADVDTLLERVVAGNDKQRFAFSPDGTRIRASQGHSVDVGLALAPRQSPPVLYHGTASRFMKSILVQGLRAGARQHVHLSGDTDTGRRVGTRHGVPVVLRVDAARSTTA